MDGRAAGAAEAGEATRVVGSAPRAATGSTQPAAELDRLRRRTLQRGINTPLYVLARAILVPFFRIYLRMEGVRDADPPRTGPLLLASNHRSFLDPFVIGALMRRPVYYVAKRELFNRRWQAWLLGGLGAFPIDRGAADTDAMATAKAILGRGECVLIFPEGTRVRPGPLGVPRRGVGRLALETGAPVVPVAVHGTEDVRAGWRLRPRKVRVRFGQPLRYPGQSVDPSHAAGVTARIWACIASQWQSLGGEVRPRIEAPRAEPRIELPPARSQRDATIATLADRLTQADQPSVPLPAARADSLAAQHGPYTLQ